MTRRRPWSERVFGAAGWALGGVMLLFLFLPVVALFVTSGPAAWLEGLRHPITAPALLLSLVTTAISLACVLVFGTPLAWWLARTRSRAARFVETCVQLPIVVPPAVAGLALLLAFGRRGLLGPLLGGADIALAFTTAAVVLAQTFVAAPFYIQAATASFSALDENVLDVARSLGASRARVLFRVALPIARRGLVAGAALAWARALGEFGATLMFAGNLQGKTQTLPLAVYTALESDLRAAQALAVVLVVVALGLLVLLRPRRPHTPSRPEAVPEGRADRRAGADAPAPDRARPEGESGSKETALTAAIAVAAGPLTVEVELSADERGLLVVGPNGAGKTTILRGLLGVRPARGTVRVGDELLFDSARGLDVPTEERRLAYVPQDYALFPHLSAADNVAFALRGPRADRRRRARALLERLGAGAIAERRPAALSGGERQRVALARALALEPRALLLDEPLAALDVESKDGVRAFLAEEIRKLGRPFILVTHDLDDVRAFAAPVLVVEKGRVVQRGERAALARSPATAFAAKFFAEKKS